ncbi:uncharacterized protein LOC117504767 [Thalassophryne amazonica]|uniref:uncharacterized protein LOC117504767 n=1 Tax=Thalassophryne amazonica TaxID=390379 RepID=UPI0014725206|nr:uncharacterized protein LOC117504767 [Thalassophryne amazonica]
MDKPTTEKHAINSKPAPGKCIKVLNTVTIVLLGQSKAGKSSLANTIFGEDTFKTNGVFSSGLLEAESKTIHRKRITLINTPGFFNSNMSDKEMKSEIVRCTTECAPQPHAFLIVLKVEKTEKLNAVITKMHKYFSDDIFNFATVVFTHGNQLPTETKIEEFVHENECLRDLVKKCGGRCHIVDNKFWKNQQDDSRNKQVQVANLLKTIDKMFLETLGGYVSNKILQAIKTDEKINMNVRNMLMNNTSIDAKNRTSCSVVLLETGAATRGGTEAAEPEEPQGAPQEKEAEGKSVNREPKNVWIKVTGPAAQSVAEVLAGAADLQEEEEEEEEEKDETEVAPKDVEPENPKPESPKIKSLEAVRDGEAAQRTGDVLSAHQRIVLLGKTGVGKSSFANLLTKDNVFEVNHSAEAGTMSAHQRIVLVGKTGAGKSSLANLLTKDNVFKVNHFAESGTSKCKTKSTTVSGRAITVIDTPGFFDTKMDEDKQKKEIFKFITECSPGPHVLLILLKVEKYTEQEQVVINKISECFSAEYFRFAAVVFTHGDQLPEGVKIEQFVAKPDALRELVKKCGDRCHVIDNKYWKKPQDDYRNNEVQVAELFKSIDKIIEENDGGYYTNEMFQNVEKQIAEAQKRIRESSGNLTDKETRKRAKKATRKKLWIIYAGTTAGALLGAACGGIAVAVLTPVLAVGAVATGAVAAGSVWDRALNSRAESTSFVLFIMPVSAHQRIILLGKTGVGKSSVANLLIKDNVFEVNYSAESGTSECKTKSITVSGRSITVIDTPGFFHTNMDEDKKKEQSLGFMIESSPGPHVFLILCKVEKYTGQEDAFIKNIIEYFSEECLRFAVVVFTHGDQLPEGMKIEQFAGQIDALRNLLKKCGDRCHVIDIKYWKKPQDDYRNNEVHVAELFKTIDKIIEENNGGYYTNEMLQKVEEQIAEEEKHIRESSGNLTEEEIRERAKEAARKKLLIIYCATAGNSVFGSKKVWIICGAGVVGTVFTTLCGWIPGVIAAALVVGAAANIRMDIIRRMFDYVIDLFNRRGGFRRQQREHQF